MSRKINIYTGLLGMQAFNKAIQEDLDRILESKEIQELIKKQEEKEEKDLKDSEITYI